MSAVKLCNISQCFIQSPLLCPPLSVCVPTLVDSVPHPGPSSALKSPPTIRISRVAEVNTHQFDALVVYHDRGSDGPFVDVFGIDNLLPQLPVQHNSNSVFVAIFSCTHEYSTWANKKT